MLGEMKTKVHVGHLGVNSTLRLARDTIFWPGMSSDIRQYIKKYGTCATYSTKQRHESPIITTIPPRQKLAADLCSWGGKTHLAVYCYHSNFFGVDELELLT